MLSGIYWFYQISRDRAIYIGSSKDVELRFKEHKGKLNSGKHRNRKLLNTWRKYGAADFILSVLQEVDVSKLVEREQFWMDAMPAWPTCNIAVSSENFARGRKCGPRTPGHIELLRKAHLGRKASLEAKRRMSEAQRGNKRRLGHTNSAEARAKISQALRGRKKTPEHIRKVADKRRGHKHSEEQKRLWSEQRRGKPWSEARRKAAEGR